MDEDKFSVEEFDDLFGNTRFENIKKIRKYINENYIPKSKVQERIEDLKECCKNCNFRGSICKDFKAFNQCTFQVTIKNLQELLEES